MKIPTRSFRIQIRGAVKWTSLRSGFYWDNGQYPTREAAYEAAKRRLTELRMRDSERDYRIVGPGMGDE